MHAAKLLARLLHEAIDVVAIAHVAVGAEDRHTLRAQRGFGESYNFV